MNFLLALQLSDLFRNIPSGIAQGLIWGIMALGLFITFRILDFADLTVDGSFTTGGAICVMAMLAGLPHIVALLLALLGGLLAGLLTGFIHTKFKIPPILSGILTQFALYSINLAIMGFAANKAISPDQYQLLLTARSITSAIFVGGILTAITIGILYWFFGTQLGSAIRATGNNPLMAKAQGININTMKVIGLSISNMLVAFSGGLMAQYQGFADINMGRGAIVIGLAAIIIGEVICDLFLRRYQNFAAKLGFMSLGGMIYYFVVIIVLWLKLNSNLLKLFTAVIVTIFLALPYLKEHANTSFAKAGKHAKELIQKRKEEIQ